MPPDFSSGTELNGMCNSESAAAHAAVKAPCAFTVAVITFAERPAVAASIAIVIIIMVATIMGVGAGGDTCCQTKGAKADAYFLTGA
jgi:hypothetical protein